MRGSKGQVLDGLCHVPPGVAWITAGKLQRSCLTSFFGFFSEMRSLHALAMAQDGHEEPLERCT